MVDILEVLGQINVNLASQRRALHDAFSDKEDSSVTTSGPVASRNGTNEIYMEGKAKGNCGDENQQDDMFLVDWNGPDDPDIPLNWDVGKKTVVILEVMLLTCVTYMGASIYIPGQEEIQEEFRVGHVVGTLNMSMYVLGYGLGPMIFSPLSEVSTIGRQQIYMITFIIFMVIQAGAATVQNIGGLVVIRFFSGVFCSPALATGAASMGDIVGPEKISKYVGLWAVGCLAAPVIAPLLGACMVIAKGWRYIFWLLMWICAVTFIILAFFFPETSHENILYRRAIMLRKITGDNRYHTRQERLDANIKPKQFLLDTFYRPFKIIAVEYSVLAFDIYTALAYGAFYLFFEAFPIVFGEMYHFSLIEQGLAYMGFCVGCVVAYTVLFVFITRVIDPRIKEDNFRPETFLILPMWVCWGMPFSLFFFGWTAGVHWILPIIAQIFFVLNVFNLFQCSFSYLAVCFPKYYASVMAGNGLFRAVFACAFPLFGRAMYKNLGTTKYPVAWGSSLIGFFGVGLAAIPFIMYKNGSKLRGRSRYAA